MAHLPDIYPNKACARCAEVKLVEAFGKDAKSSTGLRSYCRSCHNADGRRYYQANRKHIDAKNSKWRKDNPKKVSEYSKKWREANPETVVKLKAEWRSIPENKKLELQSKRDWSKENKNKVRLYAATRRARKRNSDSALVTDVDLQQLYSKPCIYCGAKAEQIDHVIPLARGGRHAIGNLASSCTDCNQSKGSKFVMEWKKTRVRYN